MKKTLVVWILLWALLPTTLAVAQEVGRRGGAGLFVQVNSPLLKFRDMYSETIKFGAVAHYQTSSARMAEVEYHYSKFTGGSLENRMFRFKDGNDYASPQAKSDMTFNSVLINWLFALQGKTFNGGGSVPYLTIGAGFYDYSSEVSGLIFPEQGGATLNQSQLLEPVNDTRTALGINGGAGVQIFMSPSIAFDLRARYNVIIGELRPFLNWGVERTHPLHLFDIGAGVKFYM